MKFIHASAHETGLEPKSVHCVITSPPYWGLRKYAGNQGIKWPAVDYAPMPGLPAITIPEMQCDLGQEETPEQYIGHMILIMREMWRVLRDDGTAWANVGDSYNGSGGAGGDYGEGGSKQGQPKYKGRKVLEGGLKPKDKVMIPARFALAAQADGWYVRSDMPWMKRNCMPESAEDRPTTTVEYIYLLAKSPNYYFDAEAIRQPSRDYGTRKRDTGAYYTDGVMTNGQPHKGLRDQNYTETGRLFRSSDLLFKTWQGAILNEDDDPIALIANPSGYTGAHFATWPEKLTEPMILAGTSSRGVCGRCGAPWERVVDKTPMQIEKTQRNQERGTRTGTSGTMIEPARSITTGWQPGCNCDAGDPIPATVLDPFNGSGTTGRVSARLGRDYIGIDISQEYLEQLAPQRVANVQMELTF